MPPSQFPDLPSSAPAHEGPVVAWRPLSGWAVLAFVLALVGAVAGLLWSWWPLAIPLGIGIGVLVLVPAGTQRGRVLAGWAVGLSLVFGTCSYGCHSKVKGTLAQMATEVLDALDDPGATPEAERAREEMLERWFTPEAIEKGAVARLRERFAAVEGALGPYQRDSVSTGSVFDGVVSLFMAPQGRLSEVAGNGAPPQIALWLEVRFESGPAWAAFLFAGGRPDSELGKGAYGAIPIFEDLRFFRTGGAGPAPKSPSPEDDGGG
jgi:hypothetical protein